LQSGVETPAAIEVQRRRMAKLVESHHADDPARRSKNADAAPAQTTFDLIAQRAKSKRAQRGQAPS
jgi:hypothetical protein